MGNSFNCTRVEDSAFPPTTPTVVPTSRRFRRRDTTMMKHMAVAHHYYDRLARAIERDGVVSSRLSGQFNPVGREDAIDWTLEMSDPFQLLYDHLVSSKLTPEVVVEDFRRSPTGYRMVAIAAHEDIDWIATLLHDTQLFKALCDVTDFSLQNNGRLLVIQPKQLQITPDGSLTSLDTQYGSLLTLAKDCNWDTSRAVPRTSLLHI